MSQPAGAVPAWSWRQRLYEATVFVASGLLLVLEIAAGRLIAPYVGVSLYTWTSVIGVMLAGLSLGNWIGGVLADRGSGHRTVGVTLALAGLTTLGVLLVLTVVAPVLQGSRLSLLGTSFVLVLSLFFAPAVLLGIIVPLLTTLALQLDGRTGRVVGRMHALAAMGSIAGTFSAGYWLIQFVGTRAIFVYVSATLLLLSLPYLVGWRRVSYLAIVFLAVAVVTVTHLRRGFENPCTLESEYYCIRVDDASADVPFGRAKSLVLDHLLHGVNHETEPGMLVAPYVHLSDELLLGYLGQGALEAQYFFAGGGAYTHPRGINSLAPAATVTVAEIDPMVTWAAVEHLFVDVGKMKVLHMDARIALQKLDKAQFDAIVGDVFHDVTLPYHLTTREYVRLVKQRLRPAGLYVLNIVDAYPDPRLVKAMAKTLMEQFDHVHVWLESLPSGPERTTFVISASDRVAPPEELVAQRGFERSWQRVTEDLLSTGTPLTALPVLTDDYVPVERLLSRLLLTELGR